MSCFLGFNIVVTFIIIIFFDNNFFGLFLVVESSVVFLILLIVFILRLLRMLYLLYFALLVSLSGFLCLKLLQRYVSLTTFISLGIIIIIILSFLTFFAHILLCFIFIKKFN